MRERVCTSVSKQRRSVAEADVKQLTLGLDVFTAVWSVSSGECSQWVWKTLPRVCQAAPTCRASGEHTHTHTHRHQPSMGVTVTPEYERTEIESAQSYLRTHTFIFHTLSWSARHTAINFQLPTGLCLYADCQGREFVRRCWNSPQRCIIDDRLGVGAGRRGFFQLYFVDIHYCHTVDHISHSRRLFSSSRWHHRRDCKMHQLSSYRSRQLFFSPLIFGGVNKTTETLEIAIQYPCSKYQAVDLGKLVTSKTFAGANSTWWPFLSPQVALRGR